MTELGGGWTLERVRDYLGAGMNLRLGDPEQRFVTFMGSALLPTAVLELEFERFLVKEADELWYLGIGGDDWIVGLCMGHADLERAIWET